MTEQDADYAVAFAVPIDTPGLTLVASPYGDSAGRDAFGHPISSTHKMVETTTVFDDVFVPWDRVYLCGEWAEAGSLAREFVEFHRFTAISYKLPLMDALLGSAMLVAEMNGTLRAGHIREKLAWLVTYVATLKELVQRAADACTIDATTGIAVPDPLVVNLAKLHFAQNYHTALQHVQDIAGGLIVSAPSREDFEHPELGPVLKTAFRGATDATGADRVRLMNLISELTSGDFGGYQAVLAIHAEGSLEAEKITIMRSFDTGPARRYAQRLAGLES
jgi:aromatic ring hydroxylase